MNISVIVPGYTRANMLHDCLGSLRDSIRHYPLGAAELIYVDDRSKDDSAEIAREYADQVIVMPQRSGAALARQTGAKHASGEILVFVDSDVLVEPNSLQTIAQAFQKDNDLAGVTGVLAAHAPVKGYFSHLKNAYMAYTFSKLENPVSFLYGSIFAVKPELMKYYQDRLPSVEDTSFGQDLSNLGYKLLCLQNLQVKHLKTYSLTSFFENNFRVPFQWACIFLHHRGLKQIANQRKGFAHASLGQLTSLILLALFYLLLGLALLTPLQAPSQVYAGLGMIWFFTNLPFFVYLVRNMGFGFGLQTIPITWVDQTVMGFGALFGLLYWSTLRRNELNRHTPENDT